MWIVFPLVFFAGFVDSIAGGGGLISLTGFLAAGVPPHLALGTNKFSNFIGTGISAAYFARKGYVKWLPALFAFAGAAIGSAVGAKLALLVDEEVLAVVMLVIIPCIAVFLLLKKDIGDHSRDLPRGRLIVLSILSGLIIGMYDGFFGPGTGTFLIMAFALMLGLDLLTACGNAKVVNFASNLAAVATFLLSGAVDLRLGIPCAACGILGNYIGSSLAVKNGARVVRPMMIFVVVLLLAKVGWDLTHL